MSTRYQRWNEIVSAVKRFRDDRDWAQFHTPKDLAAAISVEAAELLELFLWQPLRGIENEPVDATSTGRIAEELADVLIYVILLGDTVGIDLEDAVEAKLRRNAVKYPIDKARGSSKKYTDL